LTAAAFPSVPYRGGNHRGVLRFRRPEIAGPCVRGSRQRPGSDAKAGCTGMKTPCSRDGAGDRAGLKRRTRKFARRQRLGDPSVDRSFGLMVGGPKVPLGRLVGAIHSFTQSPHALEGTWRCVASAIATPPRQPGARPPGGGWIFPAPIPERVSNHEITEFEFHMSSVWRSSLPHTNGGTDGTNSRISLARSRSSATRIGLQTASYRGSGPTDVRSAP
jgi:hypothetical protein